MERFYFLENFSKNCLMPSKSRKAPKEEELVYGKLDNDEAVLDHPEMFIGSVKREKRKDWHLVETDNGYKARIKQIDDPVGLRHLFREMTSNAADNVVRSREEEIDPGCCEITVKGSTVTMTTYGKGISVKYDKRYEQWVPKYIFSDLNSGSSFKKFNVGKNRTGGGRHGIGAKGINIMSKRFSVYVEDAVQRKSYFMSWKRNKSIEGEEKIEKYTGDKSKVIIKYTIDMERFGYEKDEDYPEDVVEGFKWIAACLSFTAKIPVYFNDEPLNYEDPKKYALLYVDEPKLGKHYIHIEENVEVIAIDTPGEGKQLGFCNSIINSSGGIHVNTALHGLTDTLLTKVNEELVKEGLKPINITTIKNHITLLINVSLENPEWGGGQQKTKLSSPAPKITFPDNISEKISNWALHKAVEKQIEDKQVDEIIKNSTEGYVKKLQRKTHGRDANWAASKDESKISLTCLNIFEGKSAANYFDVLLNYEPHGLNANGMMKIRGKIRNPEKKKDSVSLLNEEIKEILARLNAVPGLDYTIEKNYKKLRYRKLRPMADSDLDGFHITGLIVTVFYHFFPSLLKRGDFLCTWLRPVVELERKGKYLRFLTLTEYEKWINENGEPQKLGYKPRYFKGLGSCTPADIKRDWDHKHEPFLIYDKRAGKAIRLAFGKFMEDKRKKWISNWDPEGQRGLNDEEIPISYFIDWYVRAYSHDTLARNLPGPDGLSRLQRKIVFTCFDKEIWGRECKSTKELKLQPNFAGRVGVKSHYHQGDGIPKSVITMAATYSNNLPLIEGIGGFGSRVSGAKNAAAPRYLAVKAHRYLALLFPSKDDSLLEYMTDDGKRIEPKFYLPILPVQLLNGYNGVSTGWSSTFQPYHPVEIANAFLAKLRKNVPFKEPTPWFRDFEGRLEFDGETLITRGVVEDVKDDSCVITALPARVWHTTYENDVLDNLEKQKKIKRAKSLCTNEVTKYIITGINICDDNGNPRPYNEYDLGLVSKQIISNMTVLTAEGKVVKYSKASAFMEDFYKFRLPYYERRRERYLAYNKALVESYKKRREYIDALERGDIVTFAKGKRLDENRVIESIVAAGFDPRYYKPLKEVTQNKNKKQPQAKKDEDNNDDEDEDEAPVDELKIPPPTVVTDRDRSTQGIEALDKKLRQVTDELEYMKKKTAEELWIDDIELFLEEYRKVYGNDARVTII